MHGALATTFDSEAHTQEALSLLHDMTTASSGDTEAHIDPRQFLSDSTSTPTEAFSSRYLNACLCSVPLTFEEPVNQT